MTFCDFLGEVGPGAIILIFGVIWMDPGIFMPLPAITRRRHTVFALSMCECVCPSVHGHILKVCEYSILQTACAGISPKTS